MKRDIEISYWRHKGAADKWLDVAYREPNWAPDWARDSYRDGYAQGFGGAPQ